MAESIRVAISSSRRLYTYLDRAFTAVDAIEDAKRHLRCAIREIESSGNDAFALRALMDEIGKLRLTESMEMAVRADSPIVVDASSTPALPLPARRSMGFYPDGYRGGPL